VDIQHPTCSAKTLIPAPEVDSPDTILAQHRGAHDAWLDSNIEIRLVEDADGVLRQDARNSDELGVSGAVQGSVRLVHASSDDLAIFDKDTADGGLIALECKFGLWWLMSQH
jgi:hypothetical protein